MSKVSRFIAGDVKQIIDVYSSQSKTDANILIKVLNQT